MVLFVLLLFTLVNPCFAAALRVVSEVNYPPFSYLDKKGQPAGFDVDLARALCTIMQRPCEVVLMPFDAVIPAVQSGKADVAISGLAKTPEREKLLYYATPYYRSRTVIIGRAGEYYPKLEPTTFAGKRLVAQAKSAQMDAVVQLFGQNSTILSAKSVGDAVQMLVDGKADIAFADSLTCVSILNSEEGQKLDYVAEPLSVEHVTNVAYITVALGNKKLGDSIAEALQELRVSGVYATINSKYFPFTIY